MEKTTLENLKEALPQKPITSHVVDKQKTKSTKDALGRYYATGKRKSSIAKLWLKPGGTGAIFVNKRPFDVYFSRSVLRMVISQPLQLTQEENKVDLMCRVSGGGLSGQAGAIRHGLGKALCAMNPDLRPLLKSKGFLTRDSRVVERKKYGRAKARRSFQFSKR